MAKMTILGIVVKVFPRKRQNQLYEHQFIRIAEEGGNNIFDVQFYNNKIQQIEENGIEEGQKVICETYVNGKHWAKPDGKEGVFLKLNGQMISKFELDPAKPKIAE